MNRKLLFIMILLVTTFTYQSSSATGFFDWSDDEWENEITSCGDADFNSDGRYDIVCTVSPSSFDSTFVYYIPELETNTNMYVQFKLGSVVRGTFSPSWYGLGRSSEAEFGMDVVTYDTILIVYWSDLINMYDSPDYARASQDTLYSQANNLKNAIYYTDEQRELYEDVNISGMLAAARLDAISGLDIIVDESPVDTYDDLSYAEGFGDGYTTASEEVGGSLNWIQSFFQLFDVIFSIELLPNITIGVLLGIALIPPIVIGVVKWLS